MSVDLFCYCRMCFFMKFLLHQINTDWIISKLYEFLFSMSFRIEIRIFYFHFLFHWNLTYLINEWKENRTRLFTNRLVHDLTRLNLSNKLVKFNVPKKICLKSDITLNGWTNHIRVRWIIYGAKRLKENVLVNKMNIYGLQCKGLVRPKL